MIEIEIKARVENFDVIEKELIRLKAVYLKVVEEIDDYYQHPCKDYKVSDEALRIRVTDDGKCYLTYKGPKIDSETKSREEIELVIQNVKTLADLLDKLGFEKVETITKQRKVYVVNNCKVLLDKVQELGNFVEIECFGNYEICKQNVFEIASALGLSAFERRSYFELKAKQT